jgi:hypothetical protein
LKITINNLNCAIKLKTIMKKTIFTFVLTVIILSGNTFAQSCLPAGITFTSQSQIDSFPFNYPGCSEVIGNLRVENNTILNLNGLSQITSIGGSLELIGNTSLTNLSGLENLTSIGKTLDLYYNTTLTSIQALSSLTHVGENIWVDDNFALPNLEGLNNVTTLNNGNLEIGGNYSLIDFTAISNLTFAKGIVFFDMPGLADFSFFNGNLTISENLRISYNNGLTSIDGLQGLTSISGNVVIEGNNFLTTLEGLNNLQSIGNDLVITSNDRLNDISMLSSLTSVGELLLFKENHQLENLVGLESLVSIGYNLAIHDNNNLKNLDALSNLTTLAGGVFIMENDSINDISGLENITSIVGMLRIEDNPMLSHCHIKSVCSYLGKSGSVSSIINNKAGCNSVSEIEDSCATPNTSIELLNLESNSIVYPNPTSGVFTIEINNAKTNKVIITDFSGKIIAEQSVKGVAKFDLSSHSGGIYFIQVQSDDISITKKLVKL